MQKIILGWSNVERSESVKIEHGIFQGQTIFRKGSFQRCFKNCAVGPFLFGREVGTRAGLLLSLPVSIARIGKAFLSEN